MEWVLYPLALEFSVRYTLARLRRESNPVLGQRGAAMPASMANAGVAQTGGLLEENEMAAAEC